MDRRTESHVVPTASVSRDDVPERGSWTYGSLVRLAHPSCASAQKILLQSPGSPRRESRCPTKTNAVGTGRRTGLYRRPVYWVACDRWKKVSLSAASSEIPRRPWRTTSLAIPFSTAGTRGRLFVRGPYRTVPFRAWCLAETCSRDEVKKFRRLNGGALRIPRGFTRVTSMSSPGSRCLSTLLAPRSILPSFDRKKTQENQTLGSSKGRGFVHDSFVICKNNRKD